MHGSRTKINERFEFPLEIDMAPYNVDHLSNGADSIDPDVFSLVGVLIHSGTAESGHYYSYIQERSDSSPQDRRWVEFNDMDVSEFNPVDIDPQCFGGWQDMPAYETRYSKLWNAYMLFYERQGPQLTADGQDNDLRPILRSPLPHDLQTRIGVDNQVFLRQFCQYDMAYVAFVKTLLQQLRIVNGSRCTSDHEAEQTMIELTLDYLANVLARQKETAQFEEVLIMLTRTLGSCPKCCEVALRWVALHNTALHNLLLRCPHPKVRKEVAGMVVLNLQKLRHLNSGDNSSARQLHNTLSTVDTTISQSSGYGDTLEALIERLYQVWEYIHLSPRAWDEYFGLLAEIANMGARETHMLLRFGFLQCCLELLMCDHATTRNMRSQQPYASYTRMLEKGRKFIHFKLLELLAIFLERIDLRHDATRASCQGRPFDPSSMLLTDTEYQYIHFRQAGAKSNCVFLEKALNTAANPQAMKRVVKALILAEPDARIYHLVLYTIKNGINIDPANLAAPFLKAALTFCECIHIPNLAERLITDIASEVDTIGQNGGREHLEFFVSARRIRSMRNVESPEIFSRAVLVNADRWAPQLLLYWDAEVRQGTTDLLKILLFQYDVNDMDDEELSDLIVVNGKKLGVACARLCQRGLEGAKPVGRTADEISNVTKLCLEQYFLLEEDEAFIMEAQGLLDARDGASKAD